MRQKYRKLNNPTFVEQDLTFVVQYGIIICNLLGNALTLHACAGVVHHRQRWYKQVASVTLLKTCIGSSP